jgi:hypothetical protein
MGWQQQLERAGQGQCCRHWLLWELSDCVIPASLTVCCACLGFVPLELLAAGPNIMFGPFRPHAMMEWPLTQEQYVIVVPAAVAGFQARLSGQVLCSVLDGCRAAR